MRNLCRKFICIGILSVFLSISADLCALGPRDLRYDARVSTEMPQMCAERVILDPLRVLKDEDPRILDFIKLWFGLFPNYDRNIFPEDLDRMFSVLKEMSANELEKILSGLKLEPDTQVPPKDKKKSLSNFFKRKSGPKQDNLGFLRKILEDLNPIRIDRVEREKRGLEELISAKSIEQRPIMQRYRLMEKYLQGPVICDVGCAFPTLCIALNHNLRGMQFIGLDVEEQFGWDLPLLKERMPNIEFRLMQEPAKIPFADNSVNTIIMTFMLHHLTVPNEVFLQEINRVLKPGGNVIILEDSFSDKLKMSFPESIPILDERVRLTVEIITDKFSVFDESQKKAILHFFDWFAHNFIGTERKPIVPGNYLSMEEWTKCFADTGFALEHQTYLGIRQLGSRHPVSRAFMVFKKPDLDATIHGAVTVSKAT